MMMLTARLTEAVDAALTRAVRALEVPWSAAFRSEMLGSATAERGVADEERPVVATPED